jgi:hypothetical protein
MREKFNEKQLEKKMLPGELFFNKKTHCL